MGEVWSRAGSMENIGQFVGVSFARRLKLHDDHSNDKHTNTLTRLPAAGRRRATGELSERPGKRQQVMSQWLTSE